MGTSYHVKIDVFEGPFDLLYHLIQQEEIDIWDIPIARITDEYLNYLDTLWELNIEVAAEFVVMAARLVRLKARLLLPDKPDQDETYDEEDSPYDLAAALQEYALFKEAATRLEQLGLHRYAYVGRPAVYAVERSGVVYEDPVGGTTVDHLAKALTKVLASLTEQRPLPIPSTRVSVGEKVQSLRALFSKTRRIAFHDLLTDHNNTRTHAVATFLALLELMRRGYVYAEQQTPFGPIIIERRDDAPDDDVPGDGARDAGVEEAAP